MIALAPTLWAVVQEIPRIIIDARNVSSTRSMTQALWSYRGLTVFAMFISAEANSTKEHDQ
eukprot:13970509-Heterocapsa_arctica.AAC.1